MDPYTRLLADGDRPPRLLELGLLPAPLYLTGELPTGFSIAIVGSRHPTAEACAFARELARGLADAGVIVISGGAEGIDSAAHEGAMDGSGKTLVVAPAAFDHPYPEKNAPLFDRIVRSSGGYLTSFPPGTPATRAQFFERNAYLAALCDALVVVESKLRGGARNAAKAARALSRPVFAVPGAPWSPLAHGCLEEIRLGASIVTSARDLLAKLGKVDCPGEAPDPELDEAPADGQLRLQIPQSCSGDPERATIVNALRQGPKNLDELCALSGLVPGRLQGLILTLTLEGIVVSDPSGRIQLGSY